MVALALLRLGDLLRGSLWIIYIVTIEAIVSGGRASVLKVILSPFLQNIQWVLIIFQHFPNDKRNFSRFFQFFPYTFYPYLATNQQNSTVGGTSLSQPGS